MAVIFRVEIASQKDHSRSRTLARGLLFQCESIRGLSECGRCVSLWRRKSDKITKDIFSVTELETGGPTSGQVRIDRRSSA